MNPKESFDSIVWTCISAVMVVLFSGNVYFAKHTLDRLDSIELMVWQLKEKVSLLENRGEISLPRQDARRLWNLKLSARAVQGGP